MASKSTSDTSKQKHLVKSPSGIKGLDEITYGGFPRGRTALVCGGPGSGKTLLAMEFLIRGAVQYGEPGVFLSFEENLEELTQNVASIGFDLGKLIAEKKILVEYVYIERSEIEETGEYDLEALFIRIGYAVSQIGAKRIVLDTLEALFCTFQDDAILRAEIRRLFRKLKEMQLTAIVTAEQGSEGKLTRHGLEEYISDCVIELDNRLIQQISTRRLRIVKYRGTEHGANEYPFLIDHDGFFLMPSTSMELKHEVSEDRVSSGIQKLDLMLEGKGAYRGSTTLVSGTAGTGKTSVAASFVDAACRRGDKVLFFSFEESPSEILRNMCSIGVDLEQWMKAGLLTFSATRPSFFGLEKHLAYTLKLLSEFKPDAIVIDPISDLTSIGPQYEVRMMLERLIDYLKSNRISALLTSLIKSDDPGDRSVSISSLIDTWIMLREVESNGERNRALHVLKSRGMANSNQVRELIITNHGVDLIDVYLGPEGVMTGLARLQQESHDVSENELIQAEIRAIQVEMAAKRRAFETAISERRAILETDEVKMNLTIQQIRQRERFRKVNREHLSEPQTHEKPAPISDIRKGAQGK